MSRFFDTYFTANSGSDACSAGVMAGLACCCCAAENLSDAFESNRGRGVNVSTVLKTSLMLAGMGVGIYCAYLATPVTYHAIKNGFEKNTDAEEWSIKLFAGTVNGVVDLLLPFAGFNATGWSVRGIEKGVSKISAALFSRPNSSASPTAETPLTEQRATVSPA